MKIYFILISWLLLDSALSWGLDDPAFGYTGTYKGEVSYLDQSYEAKLELVDLKGILRGVLTLNIDYKDEEGLSWSRASVLLKGDKQSNKLFVTDFQCSAIAKICDRFGILTKDFESNFKVSVHEEGADYKLFKIKIFDSKKLDPLSERPIPITRGELTMGETLASAPSTDGSWVGSWSGVGFFPENFVVRVPLPFFSELDTTFYKDQNGRLAAKWFYYYEAMGSWALNQDVYIESYSSERLVVRYDYHSYQFNRAGDYTLGIVSSDNIVNPDAYFDFWALFFLTR